MSKTGSIVMALFVLVVGIVLVANFCVPQQRIVETAPNEVTFYVDLHGAETQVVTGGVEFWDEANQGQLVQALRIEPYCLQPFLIMCRRWTDRQRIITVSTMPYTYTWEAPPIMEGLPFPDMSNAFSMQAVDSNGGSTGVYTGAEIVLRVYPQDAAKYVAAYGAPTRVGDVYPARSLADVVENEIEAFMNDQLNVDYTSRTVEQQNAQINDIFAELHRTAQEEFGPRGITIETLGNRGGNVYETAAVQVAADENFRRQRELLDAQAARQREQVENSSMLERAGVQATATAIAAESSAYSQRLQAEALNENAGLLLLEAVRRWDGHLPEVWGVSNSALPFMQNAIVQPTPTPAP